jgi:hypothetical protein
MWKEHFSNNVGQDRARRMLFFISWENIFMMGSPLIDILDDFELDGLGHRTHRIWILWWFLMCIPDLIHTVEELKGEIISSAEKLEKY